MKFQTVLILLTPVLITLGATTGWSAPASAPASTSAAQYTAAGKLIAPAGYREWVFLTSGVDMNYSDEQMGMDHQIIDNVFVDPASWQSFKATGRWPDGTAMVKETRIGSSKGSINKSGVFQTEQRFDLEVHVRDSKRFKNGWAFFVNTDDKPAEAIPAGASCYACHATNGAVDTTFVQFYPTAKPIAVKAGTFAADK